MGDDPDGWWEQGDAQMATARELRKQAAWHEAQAHKCYQKWADGYHSAPSTGEPAERTTPELPEPSPPDGGSA